jgi:UDP-glucose 4-epimerase
VVAANLAAADVEATGPFNVGTGIETSVLDLVQALGALAGAALAAEHAPERPGEVKRSVIDAARAREALGWEPGVGLSEGLERTLASMG